MLWIDFSDGTTRWMVVRKRVRHLGIEPQIKSVTGLIQNRLLPALYVVCAQLPDDTEGYIM